MGSGTSRGKKVAPACVTELNVTKTGPGLASQDTSPFDRIKIQTGLRAAQSRAQPDSLSEGQDSDLSGEEDSRVQADREDGEMVSVKKTPPKRTFLRSKTYGLCHSSQEETEDANSSAQRSEEPPGASKDVNKRNNMRQHTHGDLIQQYPSSQKLVSGNLLEREPTKQKQQSNSHNSSFTTPVILYDGSEEELMDTIEREFS